MPVMESWVVTYQCEGVIGVERKVFHNKEEYKAWVKENQEFLNGACAIYEHNFVASKPLGLENES